MRQPYEMTPDVHQPGWYWMSCRMDGCHHVDGPYPGIAAVYRAVRTHLRLAHLTASSEAR